MPGLFDISGRHALVTGASGGLGEHFAELLAGSGAKVTLAARREDALAAAAERLRAAGGQAHGLVMDITDLSSVEHGFADAEARFGPVAILVNNAGVALTRGALEVEEAEWDRVLDTNLKGAWLAAKAAARRMIGHGTGAASSTSRPSSACGWPAASRRMRSPRPGWCR